MLSKPDSKPEGPTADAPLFAAPGELSSQRQNQLAVRLIAPATCVGDLLIIALSSVLSDVGYQQLFLHSAGSVKASLVIAALVFANFFALMNAQQNYRLVNLINIARQFRHATLTWLFIFSILIAITFALKIASDFSRGVTLLFFIIGWASLLTFRIALAKFLTRALAKGAFVEQKIIVIAERGQQTTPHTLAELRRFGYRPIKIFELKPSDIDRLGTTKSLKQTIQSVISTGQTETVEFILLLLKWDQPQLIKTIVRMLHALPFPVHLVPDDNVATLLAGGVGNIGRTLSVELQRAPLTHFERALKRVFDITFSATMIILLSPIMLIAALLVKLDFAGPILFEQKRHGFNGHEFNIFKFRTMRVLEDGDHIQQATRNDPRVTRIGRWLRMTSIDELPQLFNVLFGEMSIVGPRPHAIAHNNEYQALISSYAFRHHVKPGITGWAQVNGFRGQTQTLDLMSHRVEYDLWYISHWSIWLDLKIILKTLVVLCRSPNAY